MQIKKKLKPNPKKPDGQLAHFLSYTFKDKKIIINYQGTEEVFDFSNISIENGFVAFEVEKLAINPFLLTQDGNKGVRVENREIKAKLIDFVPLEEYQQEGFQTETEWRSV